MLAPITFGAAVTKATYRYLAAHPGVAIELELQDRRRVDLLAEGFDIAIFGGRVDTDSTDFVARQLWQPSRKLLYASPAYLRARGAPRRVEDLRRHDCIAMRAADGVATWTLNHGRSKRRVTIEPRFSANDSSAAYGATLHGLGVAMLPEVICAKDVAAKKLVRVLDGYEGEAGGVYIMYRSRRALTAAVRSCIDHFLAELPATDPGNGKPSRTRSS